MSSRRIQFFMDPGEFAGILAASASQVGLVAVYVESGRVVEVQVPEACAGNFFLAANPEQRLGSIGDIQPGRLGWLTCSPPRIRGTTLYLGEIASRSDWSDPEQGVVHDNPLVHKSFERLSRQLRKRLAFPVVATNIITGASQAYRAIGYSVLAKRWLDGGGQLRQEGVSNIRFGV